ncbi:MAG TPA: CHAT domain-containing protein [candidate division Zixibacteria bacterium]|nr:CHAT domain-containing protein [candidate division Zixibacteria bacterium]
MVTTVNQRQRHIDGFLSSSVSRASAVALARENPELIDACAEYIRATSNESSADAVKLSARFVERCRPLGGAAYTTALRARGWTLLVAGDFDGAQDAYLGARKRLRDDEAGRARIDRILIDVYMYQGKIKTALRRAEMAAQIFTRLRLRDDLAKTWLNWGNVHHRCDRHQDARKLYERAADYFQKAGQDYATALCWYNLANTLVQLVDFDAGRELYARAREIYDRLGDSLHATGCLYGLAWVDMLSGDFTRALEKLSECEERYRAGGNRRELILCQLDRSESYLGLNLYAEALIDAQQAERGALALGIDYEAAKGAFFAAKALIGLGNTRRARAALRRARARFGKIGNDGFKAATQLTEALLSAGAVERAESVLAAHTTFRKSQLPIWEAISAVELSAANYDDTNLLKELDQNRIIDAIPHLSAKRFTILGDHAARRQEMDRAVAYWTQAADILDAVREKLPPYELGGALVRPQDNPFESLVAELSTSDAARASVMAERMKSVGIWALPAELRLDDPARKKVQERLENLAGRYVAISGTLSKTMGRRLVAGPAPTGAQLKERSQVRRDIAFLQRRADTWDKNNDHVQGLVARLSHEIPIVQFCICNGDIYGFVHIGSAVSAHKYKDGVERLSRFTARWRFLMECSASGTRGNRAPDLAEEQRTLEQLEEWLLAPLPLPRSGGKLLIVPDGQLFSLPWMAIGGADSPLCSRYQFTIAPTIRHFVHARTRRATSRRAHVFVGNSSLLPAVRAEIEGITAKMSAADVTVANPCARADWPDTGSSHVWHYAGHARLRADNPFFSSLLLRDGELFAADFRLRRHTVNLVTLAACRTGQYSSAQSQEATGLVRGLLEMGARNVVAGHWSVGDEASAEWMNVFYEKFFAGASPALAASTATETLREKRPSVFHWGVYTVYGAD